jgi:hypothetical protein
MANRVQFSDSFPDYLLDAQYLLNPQEVRSIDKDVRRVIYRSAVAQKFLPTIQIDRGKTDHRVSIAQEPSAPIFSKDFLPESMDKIAKAESIFYLTGISKDYFISMVDIDASRNSDYHKDKIDSLHLKEMTALISEYKERVLWRGSDILNANPGAINPNMKGIMTTASVNTFNAAAADSNTGTAGDMIAGVGNAYAELIVDKMPPPYVSVMEPFVAAQAAKNINSTTFVSDLERIRGMTDIKGTPMISSIHISDHLLSAVDAGDPSAWAFIAPATEAGENTIEIYESYPQWHYPITTNKLGIQGKCLWMGGLGVIRANSVCIDVDIDVDG